MKKVISIILCLVFITASAFAEDITVYITKSGSKYHMGSCYLRNTRILLTLSDALEQGYEACSHCKPPIAASKSSQVHTSTTAHVVDKEALALPYCPDQADIINHTGYSLRYSEAPEQALWVA